MSSGRSIVQNTAWLMAATAAQKLLAFLSFTIAARLVGVTVTGEFFIAVAVTSVFVIIGDLGMTPVVIRAISGGQASGKRLLGAAMHLKAWLIPVSVVASLVYVIWSHASPVIIFTTAIACLVMSADSLHLLLYGALRGVQRLQYEAVGMFLGQVLTATAAVSAAVLGWGAPGLALALLIGSTWNVGWALMQTRLQGIVSERPTRADIRSLIRQAVPFALAGIFVKVYSYLDSLLLHGVHGTDSVGTYSVAYKVTYAFQFIPLVFTASLFPAMSSVHATGDRTRLQHVLAESLRLMAIIGAPIAAGVSAIAPRFIPLAYGLAFLGSIPALSVLPWVLLPIFLDFPIGALLNATHRAHLKTTAMGVTMLLNAALNIMLIGPFGPVGAAWAGVVSFWFMLFVGVWFVRRDLPSVRWLAWLIARALMVCIVLWLAVRMGGSAMPFGFSILFGVGVGGTMLLLVRLLTPNDVRMAMTWLRMRMRAPDPVEEEGHG